MALVNWSFGYPLADHALIWQEGARIGRIMAAFSTAEILPI